MPDLFRTIRFRLTLWFTGIFSVSAAVAFILFYYLAVQTLQDQIDQELLDKASQFSSVIRQSGMRGAGNLAVIESKAAGEKMIFFRLLYPTGEVFASSHMSYWKDIQVDHAMLDRLMENKTPVFDTRMMDNAHKARILYAFVARNAILQTGITMESQSRLLSAFKRVFMVAMGFIVGFSALSGWFLVQKALSRVDTITRTAKSITGSSLQKRVPVTGSKDELDHLASTFNQMLDRIESLVSGIREMGDNMAHDLKSPVTRIRGVAEMTLLQGDSLEEFHAMAANTIEEADRLLDMINTMLVISRTRAGQGDFHFEPLNLTRMIQEACNLFAPVAEDKDITFQCQVPGRFGVMADVTMLQRAFSNLLDNAIKYTDPGGRITVDMIRKNDLVLDIHVSDTGPGIPEALHDRIFDRFFRAESSRTSPGSGLGLSFARAIAREHGGDIQIQSSPGEGACFTLTLPYCNFQVI
ncbi:MAG: ATP-binding protein [Desulfotignum sp.]|nr:ATP-binding protein [Desulfotignum sp.]